MKRLTVYLVLLAQPLMAIHAWADRTLVWNKQPITIVLPVGKEVRVTFPTEVALQLPMAVTDKLESLAPNEQVLYWKAKEAFDPVRAIAASSDNESVYLIDLVAQPGALTEAIRIEDPDRIVASVPQDAAALESVETELLDPPEIVLTRFASQSLYAPRRLMPVNGDIHKQAISALPADFPLMRSQQGERYAFSVVGAWSGYGRYITAVMVSNESAVSVQINPGLVIGNFTHITPQHLTLGPLGSLEDRTTLYLISDVPFASAILEDGYGY
jgi:integrating conjugative element protein (TIGR03749 family)